MVSHQSQSCWGLLSRLEAWKFFRLEIKIMFFTFLWLENFDCLLVKFYDQTMKSVVLWLKLKLKAHRRRIIRTLNLLFCPQSRILWLYVKLKIFSWEIYKILFTFFEVRVVRVCIIFIDNFIDDQSHIMTSQ